MHHDRTQLCNGVQSGKTGLVAALFGPAAETWAAKGAVGDEAKTRRDEDEFEKMASGRSGLLRVCGAWDEST